SIRAGLLEVDMDRKFAVAAGYDPELFPLPLARHAGGHRDDIRLQPFRFDTTHHPDLGRDAQFGVGNQFSVGERALLYSSLRKHFAVAKSRQCDEGQQTKAGKTAHRATHATAKLVTAGFSDTAANHRGFHSSRPSPRRKYAALCASRWADRTPPSRFRSSPLRAGRRTSNSRRPNKIRDELLRTSGTS